MAEKVNNQRDTNTAQSPETGQFSTVRPDMPAHDQDDAWAHSSWDLRQGLDVAELDEVPAEWPDTKPR